MSEKVEKIRARLYATFEESHTSLLEAGLDAPAAGRRCPVRSSPPGRAGLIEGDEPASPGDTVFLVRSGSRRGFWKASGGTFSSTGR